MSSSLKTPSGPQIHLFSERIELELFFSAEEFEFIMFGIHDMDLFGFASYPNSITLETCGEIFQKPAPICHRVPIGRVRLLL